MKKIKEVKQRVYYYLDMYCNNCFREMLVATWYSLNPVGPY